MEQATLIRLASFAERVQLDAEQAGDHIDRLFRAAWALCGSREDAEDLVQETYARVLAKPRFLRSEDHLGYLLRTLLNTFLNQKRTESRRLRTAPLPDKLDVDERTHLFALAGRAATAHEIAPLEDVRPGLLRLLDAVEPLPAFIVGPWLDLLAWNPTASALFCGFERRPSNERNMARLIFLDPEIRELFCVGGWDGSGLVGALRVRYEQRRPDPRVQALISELNERSPLFRRLWQERGVVKRMKGRKTFDHPEVGRIELDWDRLTVPGSGGQVLMVYSAEQGTPAATALTLLATLAATAAQPS